MPGTKQNSFSDVNKKTLVHSTWILNMQSLAQVQPSTSPRGVEEKDTLCVFTHLSVSSELVVWVCPLKNRLAPSVKNLYVAVHGDGLLVLRGIVTRKQGQRVWLWLSLL